MSRSVESGRWKFVALHWRLLLRTAGLGIVRTLPGGVLLALVFGYAAAANDAEEVVTPGALMIWTILTVALLTLLVGFASQIIWWRHVEHFERYRAERGPLERLWGRVAARRRR
jgi:hypothetical protein